MVIETDTTETDMINGRLEITKIDLLGYTKETQAYIVSNASCPDILGGSTNNFNFLKSHDHCFDLTRDGYMIKAPRLPKFRAYLESKGFELVGGGAR